jgi:hypothetical protein
MTTRITVSLPPKEHPTLIALAEKYEILVSWLTRKARPEFLHQKSKGEMRIVPDLAHRNETSSSEEM